MEKTQINDGVAPVTVAAVNANLQPADGDSLQQAKQAAPPEAAVAEAAAKASPEVILQAAPLADHCALDAADEPSARAKLLRQPNCEATKRPTENDPLSAFIDPFETYLREDGRRGETTVGNILARLSSLKANAPNNIWPEFTTVPLVELRKKHIANLQKCLEKVVQLVSGESYKGDTRNAINSAVRQLLKFICDELELIDDEKFLRLAGQLKFVGTNAREIKVPSNDQIEIMRLYLKKRHAADDRDTAQIPVMFEVYRTFGLRKGMMATLIVGDIDSMNSRIRLTLNKQRKGKLPPTLNLLMPEQLKIALREYITTFNLKPHEPLFTIKNINRSLKSAAAAAGLPNWYHHAFRKLVTIRMIELSVPVPVIAAILGHRDNGATILKNYWKHCVAAMDKAMISYSGYCEGDAPPSSADTVRLKARLYDVIDRLCEGPPDAVKACSEFFFRIDEHVRAGNYGSAVALLPKPPEAALPTAATVAVPNLPCSASKERGTIVAHNVIYLMLSNGWGSHQLEAELDLYTNCLYNLRRGQALNQQTIAALADHFAVEDDYFYDPSQPRADIKLIRKNLVFLCEKLGARRLPCPELLSDIIDGKELPCGRGLRRLAEEFSFLTIPTLMNLDISSDAKLVGILENLTRERVDAKRNVAAHIQLYYWFQSANGVLLAKKTGLKSNMIHAYASGRQLPSAEGLVKIGEVLQKAPEVLCAEIWQPDAVSIGQRVATWLKAIALEASTAASLMGTSRSNFQSLVNGSQLPSVRQLRRMATFFNRTLAEIVGLPAELAQVYEQQMVKPSAPTLESSANNEASDGDLPKAA